MIRQATTISRTKTPATVPPAMAPLLVLDGCELGVEVELLEVELVEAGGGESQSKAFLLSGVGMTYYSENA